MATSPPPPFPGRIGGRRLPIGAGGRGHRLAGECRHKRAPERCTRADGPERRAAAQARRPSISDATLGAWRPIKLDPPAHDRPLSALRCRTLHMDLPIKLHESPHALKAAHDQATRDLEAAKASGDPIAIPDPTALRDRARLPPCVARPSRSAAPSPSTSTAGRSATFLPDASRRVLLLYVDRVTPDIPAARSSSPFFIKRHHCVPPAPLPVW